MFSIGYYVLSLAMENLAGISESQILHIEKKVKYKESLFTVSIDYEIPEYYIPLTLCT